MKVLVIGNGGREHALVWKLAQSPRVDTLYCAPGNAGIERHAQCVPLVSTDIEGLKTFATERGIDLTVVGPEQPLALGIADAFRKARLRIFGPTQGAARIESSKAFAKNLMTRARIPTAAARTFDRLPAALSYIDTHPTPLVVKADGLAQGKGVLVAETREEAKAFAADLLEQQTLGSAGHQIMIEECLDGAELSVMAFVDGKEVRPMIAAQDHKRVGEGDTGPNTGGMGAYAPAPQATAALLDDVRRSILEPIVEELGRVGSPFYGVLYAGLMVAQNKPYVLEFNARWGDPEAQVVLPLLQTDLVEIMEAVVEHRLDQLRLDWAPESAVCVVLASGGYPGPYETGKPVAGLSSSFDDDQLVFHAGTKHVGGDIVTTGGRVLGVTARGADLAIARDRAYAAVERITFTGCTFRSDIGKRALDRQKAH